MCKQLLLATVIVIVFFVVGTQVTVANNGDLTRIPKKLESNERAFVPANLANAISQETATIKAKDILSTLGIKSGQLDTLQLVRDTVNQQDLWQLRYKGAWVDVNPYDGKVVGISNKDFAIGQHAITDASEAEKVAKKLYNQLKAPSDYQLISVTNEDSDYWSALWEKEVVPGVLSGYESVKIVFSSDNGRLRLYHWFNKAPNSTQVTLTQEQAINIASSTVGPRGFKDIVEAKLNVIQPNYYWTEGGPYSKADYTTLAWTVKFSNGQNKNALVWVDAQDGSILGGDQTL